MLHLPRFWKHKETKEVIDHLTYSDLKEPHSSNFEECDVTGELLNQIESVEPPTETPFVAPVTENSESYIEPPVNGNNEEVKTVN